MDTAPSLSTWKDKILDYEIETCVRLPESLRGGLSWKDKILDYEIETSLNRDENYRHRLLEKIRFSITRLKQDEQCSWRQLTNLLLEKIRFSITRLKPGDGGQARFHPEYLKR